ncbi:hypothetical protein [Roseofilum casamattae]|uniref:Sulfotransferase domain-containing protein n=1 Tax=Roseofilum casamattae BLCC-M143 TaxID=3022442 RepID=A0ABT7BU32_9CYAN|nr:hypothetical protein [Roseofilum casamattae]MDJ1182694.1 hypothetical protein [Roseofilum casamattae BLCC-M143]
MERDKKIVYYPDAQLANLDAGVAVAYPLPDGSYKYYNIPNFLIIGAPKCGTSELRDWLSIHQKVRALSSEGHFFDEVLDVEREWPRYVFNSQFLISKERNHFRENQDIQTCEKTPAYLDKRNRGVPVPEAAKELLDSHYKPWNEKLQNLLPHLSIAW